ncbi:uncharacterized protein LOC142625203 [Castanea sativa]|uniref:uncharacterized protein LOC142625203 n=1 Tax=Castanea sativa TaxID=21020 RepID=UPI003F64EBE0
MAPKVGRKFKTIANRNPASSSSASPLIDRITFLPAKTEEVYETLTKQRQAQIKNVKPSTGTSKRPRGEASTATPASGDMHAAEEVHVDPTTVVDPFGDDDVVDPIVTPSLSLRAMMESFMTTQAAHVVVNNFEDAHELIDTVILTSLKESKPVGHDESIDSKNRGNFIELIKFTSTFNDKVASVVLENAPQYAKYTSPTIQKEILHILASKVRKAIREEIGDAKFCILIDEARDDSKIEQMAIILRFVDKNGFFKERFFHVVYVRDTTALTLKKEICVVLSRYDLHIENIRGQGYDGASNMHGEWNGLQAPFFKECPYAYYVHCMSHSKCNDESQYAQREQIENMISSNEIETRRGANQIGTLQRAGDTRWGSHFQSICSLIKMFDATCKVINTISEEGANYKQRGDADGAYQVLTSFEFTLILHMMKKIMGITNILCQALQQHSQDLLNVMHLVSTTKSLIQKLRDDGWKPLLASDTAFCGQHEIDIPYLNVRYTKARGRYHHQDEALTTIETSFKN